MALLGLGGLGGLLALFGDPEEIGSDKVESFLSGHCGGEGCPGEASKGLASCACVRRDEANCEASRPSRSACCRSSGGPFSTARCTSSNRSLAARTEPFTGAVAPGVSGTPYGLPGPRAALLIYLSVESGFLGNSSRTKGKGGDSVCSRQRERVRERVCVSVCVRVCVCACLCVCVCVSVCVC